MASPPHGRVGPPAAFPELPTKPMTARLDPVSLGLVRPAFQVGVVVAVPARTREAVPSLGAPPSNCGVWPHKWRT